MSIAFGIVAATCFAFTTLCVMNAIHTAASNVGRDIRAQTDAVRDLTRAVRELQPPPRRKAPVGRPIPIDDTEH